MAGRFVHEWAEYQICRGTFSWQISWVAFPVIAIAVLIVTLVVPYKQGGEDDVHPDASPTVYMVAVVALLTVALVVDEISGPTAGIIQQLAVFQAATARLITGDIDGTKFSVAYDHVSVIRAAQALNQPRLRMIGSTVYRFSSKRCVICCI